MSPLPPLPKGASLDDMPALPEGASLDGLPPLPKGAVLDDKPEKWALSLDKAEAPALAPKDAEFRVLSTLIGPDKAALAVKSGNYKPGEILGMVQPDRSAMGMLNRSTGFIGSGARDVTLGQANNVQHLLSRTGAVSPEDMALSDAIMRAREAGLQSSGAGGSLGRFAGNTAATFSPVSLAGKAGKAMTPVQEAVGFWRGLQAATGAGGLMGMAGAAVQPEATTGSVAKGGLLGAALTPPLVGGARFLSKAFGGANVEMPPAMEELQTIADKNKVSLPAGFLDKGLAKTQDALSHVPLSGMGEAMSTTQSEAHSAAKRLVDQLKARVVGNGTASEIARESGLANQNANREVGHQIYDAVTQLAGTKQAPSFNTIQTLQEELLANSKLNSPDKPWAKELGERIARLKNLGARAPQGQAPMDRTFGGLSNLRSEFMAKASEFEKGTPQNARYLKMAEAVEKDMDAFVDSQGNPALRGVYDQAKSWWRQRVKDYSPDSNEYSAWAKSMRGKDLDQEKVLDAFVQANQAGKAKYFYAGLDDNGRAAVRWGMAQDALDAATNKGTQPFSPAKWATEFTKKQEAAGVFFRGQDKWEVDGFNKLMRALENSPQGEAVHRTGKAAIFPAIAGAQGSAALGAAGALASGNPGLAAASAASAITPTAAGRLGTWLFTSPAGKRILLAASSAGEKSTALRVLAKDLESLGANMAESAEPTSANAIKKFSAAASQQFFKPQIDLATIQGIAGTQDPRNAYKLPSENK